MLALHSSVPLVVVIAASVGVVAVVWSVTVPTRVAVGSAVVLTTTPYDAVEGHTTIASRCSAASVLVVLTTTSITVVLPHSYRTTAHTASAVLMICGHLIANLQLTHEKAERGDQLNQVSVFRAHDMHLVLFIGLLVYLLLEV